MSRLRSDRLHGPKHVLLMQKWTSGLRANVYRRKCRKGWITLRNLIIVAGLQWNWQCVLCNFTDHVLMTRLIHARTQVYHLLHLFYCFYTPLGLRCPTQTPNTPNPSRTTTTKKLTHTRTEHRLSHTYPDTKSVSGYSLLTRLLFTLLLCCYGGECSKKNKSSIERG